VVSIDESERGLEKQEAREASERDAIGHPCASCPSSAAVVATYSHRPAAPSSPPLGDFEVKVMPSPVGV
jgi:hypothetical protein